MVMPMCPPPPRSDLRSVAHYANLLACYPHYYVEMPSRVDMVDKLCDAELVALARSGDKEAFGALAVRHQAMARRVARGLVADRDIAGELASEAVLQAYLSLDRLRAPERFQSWLYGIVLHVCRDYLRSREAKVVSLEALTGGFLGAGRESRSRGPSPDLSSRARSSRWAMVPIA